LPIGGKCDIINLPKNKTDRGNCDMNNSERRDRGLAYMTDKDVFMEMMKCRKLISRLNHADYTNLKELLEITGELLNNAENAFINPPFFCDYGSHIEVGKNFYANYNCTILDVARVKIGDNCLLGPNVAIYTAGHPIHPETRISGYEYGKEIVIGDNVWIGGNSVVCPGVSIGDNVVIGAGSVVTRDIPSWTLAAGDPCRVIRRITEDDRRKLFRDEEIDSEAWSNIQGF
jgi:maltose O-acetyltransferase